MRIIIQVFIPLLFFGLFSCGSPLPSELPNIVLINIDDMGWKDQGFMGSEYYETPVIDRLAQQGMIFSNGYATAANCAPSRACMMTGLWSPRHGMYTVASSERGASKDRKLIPIKNTTTLSESFEIFPEILNEQGYATFHSGKWHLSKSPLQYGFDYNIGGGHNGAPTSYYPPYKNVTLEEGNSEYLTDLIMEKTLEIIATVRSPFFLNYAPYAVHTPIQPVDSLLSKYENKAPSNEQSNPGYATMVENLDRNIGLLIDKLIEWDLYNNTFIIFTCDNGGLYGITKQPPLRAGKGSYYEGGIRVPFFFVWPGNIEANTNSEVPITNLDLFPTIMESIGLNHREFALDGNNILPLLKQQKHDLNRPLFWHFPIYLQAYNASDNENRDSLFRTRPGSVIRHENWKLHYYFEDNGIELYDLETDIGERNNLASENVEKKNELLTRLRDWWTDTSAPVPTELNPEYLENDMLFNK